MSSWDDLFVILNEAKKKNSGGKNNISLNDIDQFIDVDGSKGINPEPHSVDINAMGGDEVMDDTNGNGVSNDGDADVENDTMEAGMDPNNPNTDEFGENEFGENLPESDNPDESGLDDFDGSEMMGMDDGSDELGLGEDDPEDIDDPDGFSAMEDELGQLEPEDKERKAYIFRILVKTINIAKNIQNNFISDKDVDNASKELEQINRLIELLTYYKKYKFDALTEFDEIESIIKKAVKSIDKISKRLVSLSNSSRKKNKK